MTARQKKLWMWLLVMALLTPLGVILPRIFRSGAAWGEWTPAELEQMLGHVPPGLRKLAEIWIAPVANYAFGPQESEPARIFSYLAAAFLGIAVVAGVMFLIVRMVVRHGK